MKRVLVTGSSGFIGRHAAEEFERSGYEVIAPTSREVDLLNTDQIREMFQRLKPSHLAHFAWYGERGRVWDAHENWQWRAMSLGLFWFFLAHGGRHAFFAGSCAEYDWKSELLQEESTPLEPASVYGKAKNLLRQHIQEMQRDKLATVSWGRIFFVYGPGEKEPRLAPSILSPLSRSEPAVVRFGNHVRDFMHVRDVARTAVHLLDCEYNGVVNIASGEPVTLANFGTKLANIAGRESLLKIEYGEPTPENPLILKADVSRLRSTGFTPNYSLDEGLKTLVRDI